MIRKSTKGCPRLRLAQVHFIWHSSWRRRSVVCETPQLSPLSFLRGRSSAAYILKKSSGSVGWTPVTSWKAVVQM